jgi:ribose transport system ATP-binding protein
MSEYSLGNQQKVVFAKWIMKRSRVFILDEPTRSLDIPSRVDLYNSMNDLISKGAGILFISSDIEEILGMCDRILVLSEGRFVCDLDGKAASKEVILGYATGELQPLLPEL